MLYSDTDLFRRPDNWNFHLFQIYLIFLKGLKQFDKLPFNSKPPLIQTDLTCPQEFELEGFHCTHQMSPVTPPPAYPQVCHCLYVAIIALCFTVSSVEQWLGRSPHNKNDIGTNPQSATAFFVFPCMNILTQ